MGLFDQILGYFGQQGAATTGQVTATAPAAYSGGGPAPSGTSGPSQQQAPAPQPIQINPIGTITSWAGGAVNYVGSGITNISSGIQTFIQPVAQPITQAITSIPAFISAPVTAPVIIGSAFIGGVQSFLNPPVQQQITSPIFSSGAAYTPVTINPITNTPAGMTIFTAYGNQAQVEVKNINAILYGPTGGSFEATQVPYGHSISNIVASGGSGSLQSGMFTLNPATPVVYTQAGATQGTLSPAANPAMAALVLASPQSYSRLGAEAYGGYVMPLDNRTIQSTGAQLSTYSNPGNLANLVNPYGVNQLKQNWEVLPWNVPVQSTPSIISMDVTGRMTTMFTMGGVTGISGSSIGGSPVTVQKEMSFLDQLNYDIGGFLGIRASGLEQTGSGMGVLPAPFRSTYGGGKSIEQPSLFSQFTENLQTSMRMGFALLPGGIGITMASDTLFATVRGEPTALPFYDLLKPESKPTGTTEEQYNKDLGDYNANLAAYNTDLSAYQKGGSTDQPMYNSLQSRFTGLQTTKQSLDTEQKNVIVTPTIFDKIGQAYEGLNTGLAPYTTDIPGMGKSLSKTPDITDAGIPGEVVNFVKGTYIGATQHPVDIALAFAGGEALSFGEGLIKMGVAKAAMYEGAVPTISTVGRIASTPIAADIASIGKVALGGFILYESGVNIISQPTSAGKGEALGRTAIQFAGFGVGMNNVQMAEPNNYYSGRGFFSGKPEIGPIEKAQFKLETTARSLSTEYPSAYKEVSNIVLPGRTVEPMVKAEPDFSVLSKSGPYATEIKGVIVEQPHSVIGSSSLMQQYPKGIAESSGLRYGKDVDVLIESPSKALRDLSARTRLPEVDANTVMDVHPIPANYPGLKPSVEPDLTAPESSMLTQMFGDPYRHLAFPRGTSEVIKPGEGYTGKLTYEAAQVQFGRKSAAVSAFIEEPIQKGYRGEKDIYDFITGYQAQKSSAIAQGVPESKFASSDKAMTSFMERTFTYGTEKGQRIGDESPTVTRSARDIYDTMFQEVQQARATVNAGGELPGDMRITFSNRAPEQGVASSVFRSAFPSVIPSGVWGSSAFGSPTGSLVPSTPSTPSAARSSPQPSVMSASGLSASPSSPSPARSMISDFVSPSVASVASVLGSAVPSAFRSPSPSSPSPSSPSPSPTPSAFYSPPSPPSTVTTPSPPSPGLPRFSLPPFSPPTIFPPPYPTPPSTPPRVPPPFTPFPPSTVPPNMPFPGIPGGSGLGPFQRKRKAAFTEIFNMGLDYSLKRPSKRKGKSWTQPKKIREARVAKGGKKK
jgi:hypothetical protein